MRKMSPVSKFFIKSYISLIWFTKQHEKCCQISAFNNTITKLIPYNLLSIIHKHFSTSLSQFFFYFFQRTINISFLHCLFKNSRLILLFSLFAICFPFVKHANLSGRPIILLVVIYRLIYQLYLQQCYSIVFVTKFTIESQMLHDHR